MGRFLKLIGWLIGGLVLLLIVAIVAVPVLVDPNDYKDRIAALAQAQTGRQLSLDGDIQLSLFPWLGVTLNRVRLANAAGFEEPVFAALESADVKVKVLPLLRRRVEADTVTVRGLRLNLARNAAGVGNWEDLTGTAPLTDDAGYIDAVLPDADVTASASAPASASASASASDEQAASSAGDAPPALLAGLSLDGLTLSDAAVDWRDAASGQRASVSGLQLETGAIAAGRPFPLDLRAQLAMPGHRVALQARTTASVEPAAPAVTLSDLRLDATLDSAALPGGPQPLSLRGDATYDGGRQSVVLGGLEFDGLGLNLRASLNGQALNRLATFSGELRLAPFDPRELLRTLGLDGALPVTADPDALRRASAELRFGAVSARQQNDLTLALTLDDSRLDGTLSRAAGGAIGFDLSADQIDLDRYLPPPAADAPPPVETPGSVTAERAAAGGLPLEPLRALNLEGTLRVGKLHVNRLWLSDVELLLGARDGLLSLLPRARLYGGRYVGDIGVDVTGPTPFIRLDEELSGVRAGPLLQDLTGEERISGLADANARLTLSGADPAALKRSLNGTAAARFSDGAVRGINIGRLLREAKAALQGRTPPADADVNETDFSELSASVTVTDGVVENQDLQAKSPLLRVSGQGRADLPRDSVDYRLTVALVDTSKGQGGRELEDLRGIPIPIRISGALGDPGIGLDLAAVLRDQAGDVVRKETDKLLDDAKKQVKDQLGEQFGEQAGDLLEGGAREVLKGLLGD